MRSFLVIILFIGLLGMAESGNLKKSTQTFYGSANNWQQYSPRSIFIEIDFSELNLKHKPYVSTSLGCTGLCWTSSGSSSIYNLTNKSFAVYIYKIEFNWTVKKAL